MNEMVDFNRKLVNECLMKMKDKNILDLSDNGGIHKNNSFKDYFMRMQAEAKNNSKTGLNTNLDAANNNKTSTSTINENNNRKLIQPAIDLDDEVIEDSRNNAKNHKGNKESDIKLFDEKESNVSEINLIKNKRE